MIKAQIKRSETKCKMNLDLLHHIHPSAQVVAHTHHLNGNEDGEIEIERQRRNILKAIRINEDNEYFCSDILIQLTFSVFHDFWAERIW